MEEYRRRGPSRAAVKQLKESVQNAGHRTGLPPKLLQLFGNREVPFTKPKSKKPAKLPYTGLAAYVGAFSSPGDADYDPPTERGPSSPRLFRNRELPLQARINSESKLEKYLRLQKYKKEDTAAKIEQQLKDWSPNSDPNIEGDPYKTLFIARMSFDVTDKKLKREFEEFGPIKRIRVVTDKTTGKPRGYAFIEYEHKHDMKEAYKTADGKKIEGRRVLVDVERGRTVENWRPRRLGGGSGGGSRDAKEAKHPNSLGKMLAAAMERAGIRKEAAHTDGLGDHEREFERERERQRGERDRIDRERADRDRVDRDRMDRERRDRDRGDRDRDRDRYGGRDRGRDDRDRERRDRDKRPREPSPRRDDYKRRHTEDGEVRGDRRRRERDLL